MGDVGAIAGITLLGIYVIYMLGELPLGLRVKRRLKNLERTIQCNKDRLMDVRVRLIEEGGNKKTKNTLLKIQNNLKRDYEDYMYLKNELTRLLNGGS